MFDVYVSAYSLVCVLLHCYVSVGCLVLCLMFKLTRTVLCCIDCYVCARCLDRDFHISACRLMLRLIGYVCAFCFMLCLIVKVTRAVLLSV